MSADDAEPRASAGAEHGTSADFDRMLEQLDTAIETATEKIESGRVRDEEKEKIRIKWIRALAYTINVRRQIVADRDLEELAERLEQLEEVQGIDT